MAPKLIATAVLTAANIALSAMQTTEGPRVKDTGASLAEYGTPCNYFMGTVMLPAHYVFTKPIREEKVKRKGKGGKQTSYTGYGTMFLHIADQTGGDVLQIYMDNHLVYDRLHGGEEIYPIEEGFDLEDHLRFLPGGPTQMPDPDMLAYIEARDGPGTCPGYRHCTGMYIEDLPLTNFGNRRPDVKVLMTTGQSFEAGQPVELKWQQSGDSPTETDKATMGLRFLDEDGFTIDESEAPMMAPPNLEWIERTHADVIPAGTATIQVRQRYTLTFGGYINAYIDDIRLTINGVAQRLTNPGAEKGDTTGWTGNISVTAAAPAPYAGNYSFVGGDTQNASAYQNVTGYSGDGGKTLGDLLTRLALYADADPDEFDYSAATQIIPGYKWTQGSGRQIAEPMCDIYDTDVRPHDFRSEALPRGSASAGTIETGELVWREDGPYELEPEASQDLPRVVFLTFADPDNGYEINTAVPEGGPNKGASGSAGELSIDLSSLTLPADTAQDFVERRNRRQRFAALKASFDLSRRRFQIEPGEVLTPDLDGEIYTTRLTKMTIGADGVIATEWERDDPRIAALPGSAGAAMPGYIPQEIPSSQPSEGEILDVPLLIDSHEQSPPLAYVMAGPAEPGIWLGADWYQSDTGDAETFLEWEAIASGSGAIFGECMAALTDALPWVPDMASVLDVRINAGELTAATLAELLDDPARNLAAVRSGSEWELVQFMTPVLVGERRYEITGLLRGVRGTEQTLAGHLVGDRFILLDGTIKRHTMGAGEIGDTDSYILATTAYEPDEADAIAIQYTGASHRPLAAVHAAWTQSGADWQLAATRRTRIGGANLDGQDVPLGQASESWALDIYDGATVVRTITGVSLPLTYAEADQVTDFGAPLGAAPDAVLYQVDPTLNLRGFPLDMRT